MIAMLIERAVEITLDWPSAAFMSLLLLAATLLLYAIYYKVTDVRRMMGSRDVNGRGSLPVYIGLACLVLMAPIVIVCVLAFSGQGYLRFPPESLSLRWFAAFFGDGRWRQSLWSSTMIALIACAISTVLGFFAAYALVRSDMRAKKMMLSFMLLPIIIPHVITAIAMYFFDRPVRACGECRLDRPLPCRRRAAGGCAHPAVGDAGRRPEPGARRP